MSTINHFAAIAANLKPRAHALVARTGFDVLGRAQALAPVDTGALRASIETHMESDTRAVVSVGVEYAAYVEWGTVRAPAQAFLHPAFDAAKPAFEAGLAELLKP